MDLEKYARQLREGKNADALQRAAESPAGEKLAARLDGARLEQAARTGDAQALSAMLWDILATPEGRQFAAEVEKAVGQDGR